MGVKSVASKKGIAHGQRPVASPYRVAVAKLGIGKRLTFFGRQQFDEGDVAHLIHSHQNRVVKDAVGKSALHDRPNALDHMEIGKSISVRTNEHAGAAPLPSRSEDSNNAGLQLIDYGDAMRFDLFEPRIELSLRKPWRHNRGERQR